MNRRLNMNNRINNTIELPLMQVLISDIGDGKAQLEYKIVNEEIVPSVTVEAVKLLTDKIMKIMPEEIIGYYIMNKLSLIDFSIAYDIEGNYSIAVISPKAVSGIFGNEIDKIIDLLDNAVQIFCM